MNFVKFEVYKVQYACQIWTFFLLCFKSYSQCYRFSHKGVFYIIWAIFKNKGQKSQGHMFIDLGIIKKVLRVEYTCYILCFYLLLFKRYGQG